jgi:hypothetical protein
MWASQPSNDSRLLPLFAIYARILAAANSKLRFGFRLGVVVVDRLDTLGRYDKAKLAAAHEEIARLRGANGAVRSRKEEREGVPRRA